MAPHFILTRVPACVHENECSQDPPERPEDSFLMILDPFQGQFWMICNDSWHRFLLSIVVFARSATHQNQFSTIFHFFFFIKIIKITKKKSCFHICFPRKGTLTLTPGMGGDNLGPKIRKITNKFKKTIRTKILHTSGHFSKNLKIYL